MPFQVSCPTCASRLKLPDRLYQSRVRGRLAALHCTRCKTEFQIDGRGEPQGNKLPSVPPAADSPAAAAAPAPQETVPPANAASRKEADAAPAVVPPPSTDSPAPDVAPQPAAASPPARVPPLAALHDPSPAELKSLFSSDDGWDQPAAAVPPATSPPQASSSPTSELDAEARARARAALRASRPPKPVRTRSGTLPVPAAAAPASKRPPRVAPSPPSIQAAPAALAPAAPPESPAQSVTAPEASTSRDTAPAPANDGPPPRIAVAESSVVSAPETVAAKRAHTDLSAYLSRERTPVTASAALASAPPPREPARGRVKPLVAAACGVGVLACGVWLSTRRHDPPPALLQTRVTSPAQPAFALIRDHLEEARQDAARRARLEAEERARADTPTAKRRPPRKRRRARRATAPRAAPVERSTAPSSSKAKAGDRTPSRAFDIASANRALSAAAGRARFCGQGGALPRTVQATVVFDPSGRVRVLRISPPTSRSRASACVAAALRSARVAAFEGNPVTVSRRVSVSGNGRARR